MLDSHLQCCCVLWHGLYFQVPGIGVVSSHQHVLPLCAQESYHVVQQKYFFWKNFSILSAHDEELQCVICWVLYANIHSCSEHGNFSEPKVR